MIFSIKKGHVFGTDNVVTERFLKNNEIFEFFLVYHHEDKGLEVLNFRYEGEWSQKKIWRRTINKDTQMS